MDPRLPVEVPLINPLKMSNPLLLGSHRSPRGITSEEDVNRVGVKYVLLASKF